MANNRRSIVLTISIDQARRRQFARALESLHEKNPFVNTSMLIILLVLEADAQAWIIPAPTKDESGREQNTETDAVNVSMPPRKVLAIAQPPEKKEAFEEALARLQRRSGHHSASALIVSLVIYAASQPGGWKLQESTPTKSVFLQASNRNFNLTAKNLDRMMDRFYAGHPDELLEMAQALEQQLKHLEATTDVEQKLLANAYQRAAIAYRDIEDFEKASRLADEGVAIARTLASTEPELLLTALYRHASVARHWMLTQESTGLQRWLLTQALDDLREAYVLGDRSRRPGLKEEVGVSLALTLALAGEKSQEIVKFFNEAIALAKRESIRDESSINFNLAGVLHRQAQVALHFHWHGHTNVSEKFSLPEALKAVEQAQADHPTAMIRWDVDMEITRVNVLIALGRLEEALQTLGLIRNNVIRLGSARIRRAFRDTEMRIREKWEIYKHDQDFDWKALLLELV